MDIVSQIAMLLNPIVTRIKMMVSRARIIKVNDNTKIQTMSVALLADEIREGIERYQNYGFTSHPLNNMEALALFNSGDRKNGVIIAIGDRNFRIKDLKSGEVAIYTDEGDTIILKRNHNIEITTENLTMNAKNIVLNASEQVTINSPLATASNDLKGGQVYDSKGTIQGLRNIYNTHTHNDPVNGITSTPNQPMS